MDKVKINNQVVSMRRYVKQAKTHAINKCTKQIKFLENRKGNEEQMAKTKRKHQRLLEEVILLKKIKPDSVSKLALSKAKDWKAVLAEKNVPLEDRCFAMLANHPPVQEAVEKFHNENNELIAKIPELVKQWEGKKSRSSQIHKKNEKGKQNNSNNPNTLPIGIKKNVQKSSETLIKSRSTESLENLSEGSDLENFQNDTTEQNLAITKATKRKRVLEDLEHTSPSKKKLLAVDDEESGSADDSFSKNTNLSNHIEVDRKLSAEDGTKSNQNNKNLKQLKVCAANNLANSAEKKMANKIAEKSGNCDEAIIKSITKRKSLLDDLERTSPSEKKLLAVDDEKSYSSDDSFSDNSDLSNHESIEVEKKLSVEDRTRSNQNNENLKPSKVCAINNSAKKKVANKIEAGKKGNKDEAEIKSNEEQSEKSQDIRSKLLEISKSKIVVQSKSKNKRQQSSVETDSDEESSSGANRELNGCANVSSVRAKPLSAKARNKMKAVTVLDLNELQDVDEFPIEKSDSETEDETDEDAGNQKKDSFFLRDGEPVSESDEEENDNNKTVRRQDFIPFKKRPYGNFREQKDNSFQKRKFEKHSVNGRNSNFRDNSFMKNKDFSFKDNKRNFKRTFDNNSDFIQNKNFKFTSNEKFNNRNRTNNFSKNPKEKPFSKNHIRDAKGNNHPSKSNSANIPKKNIADDKPLHPSWEAKRKLKEAANAKFQGKRMIFND